MQIHNIAGYKFISLPELTDLRERLLGACTQLGLKGTILLSSEGINISLAGTQENIASFKTFLCADARFADISFHDTYSTTLPFKQLKVKFKKEIITLRNPELTTLDARAPCISPAEFKQWLDDNRDITVLDVRNDYEVAYGTFTGAQHLSISDFSDFPRVSNKVDKQKPIVMFCTGGIRCEKAALVMQEQGYKDVYQLDGGILGYFAQVGGAHYEGECFVFDDRIAVDTELNPSKHSP